MLQFLERSRPSITSKKNVSQVPAPQLLGAAFATWVMGGYVMGAVSDLRPCEFDPEYFEVAWLQCWGKYLIGKLQREHKLQKPACVSRVHCFQVSGLLRLLGSSKSVASVLATFHLTPGQAMSTFFTSVTTMQFFRH